MVRSRAVSGAETMYHWGGAILAVCTTHGIRVEAAVSTQPLPVGLLDGPTADLQALGQFPLAHSLRPLCPDVLRLLLGQAGPSAGEPALGPRLRLARDRALPDRVSPPLAEGEHHRELELAGGRRSIEVFRKRPELHSRPVQALITCSPQVSPVSGGAKADHVGGRSLTSCG